MQYACPRRTCLSLLAVGLAVAVMVTPAAGLDEIWDLEAVNANGEGVHHDLSTTDPVTFEGIVLNDPEDMLDTSLMWQVFVQALPTNAPPYDKGGIALWAGSFFPGTYPPYAGSLDPGDKVKVTGYLMTHNGKTNVNNRHGGVDQFEIEYLSHPGLPDPQVIPSIADCNYFDTTDSDGDGRMDRATGGERWQGQWSRLEGVRLVDPAAGWVNGTAVPITDASGEALDMFCGDMGNFDTTTPPKGKFNLTAIFDQEDTTGTPYHAGYRMWPLDYSTTHFLLWGDTDRTGDVNLVDAGNLLANFTGASGSGKSWADGDFNEDGDVDLQDAGDLLLNFTGAGGGPLLCLCGGAAAGTAVGAYDPDTGEITLSAAGIEYLRIDGEGLLTGEDPGWSFLTGSFVDDDCDDFLGFWAMNNPQTFTDESIGAVAATGLSEGDLTLVYQAGLDTDQVTIPLTIVPEPATLALVGLGLAAAAIRRRRTLLA